MAAKKAPKVVQTKAKRKTAIARATIKKGSGHISVNNKNLTEYGTELARKEIQIPLSLATEKLGTKFAEGLDISVNVKGGGYMGQAEAAKTAIAKGIVAWSESEELKDRYLEVDRQILVDDVRRKEEKKPLQSGARAKWQKSYR